MLFEGTPVHLPWSFENEKKSLSYIWKCPSNEKRVTKKITVECCLFDSKDSLLFYGPFYSLTGFPGEIQTQRFETHQVERLNMSRIWITGARASSCSFIFCLEHSANEQRLLSYWCCLRLQGYQCISKGITTFHHTEPPWGGFSSTDASKQTYNFFFAKLYIVLFFYNLSSGKNVMNEFYWTSWAAGISSISPPNVP